MFGRYYLVDRDRRTTYEEHVFFLGEIITAFKIMVGKPKAKRLCDYVKNGVGPDVR
jgi:hypothetical protein